jgi:hypothetical protein
MDGMDSTHSQQSLTELEIDAFMGPHIKRARIALVVIGILYALIAYWNYGDIAKWHDAVRSFSDSPEARASPEFAAAKNLINSMYYYVVFCGIAGVVNVILAVIASTRATFTMYIAMGMFAILTAWQIHLGLSVPGEGRGALLFLTDWKWWIVTIVVGMGFQAAWKADSLRKQRRTEAALASAA